MMASFYILLALTLLAVQACVLTAAQECAAAEECPDDSEYDDDEYDDDSPDIYNPEFNADNVIEFDVDVDIVKQILAEYEANVVPNRDSSTDDICVVNPYQTVWKDQGGGVFRSNAMWYSPRNTETFEKYHNLVEQLHLEDVFKGTWIDSDKVSVLAMFFLVRSHSETLNMHLDWQDDVHTQIVSVLIPLRALDIHLAYKDNDDNTKRYEYKVGKAIGFGGGFWHSTDVGHTDTDDIIFNLYLGADDDPEMWWHFQDGTHDELQMYMRPSKGFIQHEWYEDSKDICVEASVS